MIESRCYIYRLKGHHRLGVAWVVSTLPHPSFKTQNLSSHSLKIYFSMNLAVKKPKSCHMRRVWFLSNK